MGMQDVMMIELVADDDSMIISGGGFEQRDIKLGIDPDDVFSDESDLKIIETPFAPGGMAAQEEFPVKTLVLPFSLYDTGAGIERTISRFRKMWRNGRTIEWRVTSGESGLRWLDVRKSKGIKFSTPRDWNRDGYAKAVVTVVALQPNYESKPLEILATNPTAGSNTLWMPSWNPTDQRGYPEWALRPNGGPTKFGFADFSFGNEQDIDIEWTPGQFANRMIVTPTINVMWSVMSHPLMDSYVAADLSNAPAQMGGNDPLFWVPPYTGTEDDPVMLPVTINGPKGAQVKLTMRRYWSAESGLE